MKYRYERKNINTGDILLFSGKGLFSSLIRLATFSKISHVGIAYVIGGDIYCWESTSLSKGKKGVQISLLSNRVQSYNGKIWVRHLQCKHTPLFYSGLRELRRELKDKPYERNIWELIGSAMPWRNKSNLKSVFCSELVAEAYKRMGILHTKLPSNEFTPKDFELGGQVDKLLRLNDEPACLGEEIKIKGE